MGSIGLPSKDSPDIRLDLLTPEEVLAQTAANSTEWSGALNKEQYFRREDHLAKQELTRDGGLTAWGLIYQPNGAESRQVLAGCETYRKRGLVRTSDGKVKDGVVHGVGSVFSPREFRGKGFAGRMMQDLGERLKSWQVEGGEAIASVLYSDIGKKFYAARGWQAFHSAHVALSSRETAGRDGLPEVRLLKAEDLPELCRIDEQLLRTRLEKQKGGKPAVALLPDSATIKWHHAREDFVANELFGNAPEIKGAVAGREGERVWCYWTRVFTNPAKEPAVLHVLRLVIDDPTFSDFAPASASHAQLQKLSETPTAKAIAAVLTEAQKQAAEWKMTAALMWNPTAMTLAAARLLEEGVEVEHREDESIASLLWYGQGAWQDVDWVCNEKYGWC